MPLSDETIIPWIYARSDNAVGSCSTEEELRYTLESGDGIKNAARQVGFRSGMADKCLQAFYPNSRAEQRKGVHSRIQEPFWAQQKRLGLGLISGALDSSPGI